MQGTGNPIYTWETIIVLQEIVPATMHTMLKSEGFRFFMGLLVCLNANIYETYNAPGKTLLNINCSSS